MSSITVLRAFWRNTSLPPVVHFTTKKPCRLLGSATRGSLKILSVVCPAVGLNIEEVPDLRYRRSVVQRRGPARTCIPLLFAGTRNGVARVPTGPKDVPGLDASATSVLALWTPIPPFGGFGLSGSRFTSRLGAT